jgi:hypothetical protein
VRRRESASQEWHSMSQVATAASQESTCRQGAQKETHVLTKLVASDDGDISVSKALKVTLKREHGAGSWQTELTIEIIVLVRRSKEGVASRRVGQEKERERESKKKLTEDRNRVAGAATLRAPTSCACEGRRE